MYYGDNKRELTDGQIPFFKEKWSNLSEYVKEIKQRFSRFYNKLVRIERLAAGNPGDIKAVGEGVSELRINYGPGYRVYYKKHGQKVVSFRHLSPLSTFLNSLTIDIAKR